MSEMLYIRDGNPRFDVSNFDEVETSPAHVFTVLFDDDLRYPQLREPFRVDMLDWAVSALS